MQGILDRPTIFIATLVVRRRGGYRKVTLEAVAAAPLCCRGMEPARVQDPQ